MDILHIPILFMVLFASSALGEDALEVKFENSSRIDVSVGAEAIVFKCHFNRDALFVIKNSVKMIHVDPLSNKETVISSSADLIDGKPEFYDVKINQDKSDAGGMIVELTILKVRSQDDGKYVCQVSPGDNPADTVKAEREIVVHRPLTGLYLKLSNYAPIQKTLTDPLEIDAGMYTVNCIAEGSNPSTEDVHMYLHGEMIKHNDPVVVPMSGGERKFRTTLTGEVIIMVNNTGQEIECQAKDSTGTSMSTKLTLSVNIYDPIVHCNDSMAYHGQMNPVLSCTVNHTGLVVTGYSFQIGDSGEIIKEGDSHAKNIKVTSEDLEDGITIVTLDLHKAEHEYLDKHFYILIDLEGGHTSKESVKLHKTAAPEIEDNTGDNNPGGGAVKTSGTILSVLLCVLLRLL